MFGGISEVEPLASIAHLVPEMDEGEWAWDEFGSRPGPFILILRGREEASYSTQPSEEAALDLLAQCLNEGSHNFYRGDSYVVNSASGSVLTVSGASRTGFVTTRR